MPRVIINTTSGLDPADTTNYIAGSATINGPQPYSGAITVCGRGNTTWSNSAKNSWRVKLGAAATLLGLPAERGLLPARQPLRPHQAAHRRGVRDGRPLPRPGLDPCSRFVELTMNGTYIQTWINTFEAALYGANWLDPVNGYAEYIDIPSFIDWYMVQELTANQDSNFFSSCKMYKTRDTDTTPGKLVMGPLWDFDLSMGNAGFGSGTTSPTGFYTLNPSAGGHPGAVWLARMVTDPAFFAQLVTRWASFRTALTTGDSIFAVIDRITDRLAQATARDRRTWSYSADTPVLGDAIATFLRTRSNWLSTQ